MGYPHDNLSNLKDNKLNNNLGVTPVLIACDNSGSMIEYVDVVNNCIHDMIEGLQESKSLKNKIELSIVTFNCEYIEIVPFTRVSNINLENIKKVEQSTLATYFGMAMSMSVRALAEEKQRFKDNGIKYYQPNLIVISDGRPEFEETATTNKGIREVQNKIETEHWTCIPIFIGEADAAGIDYMKKICVPSQDGKRTVIHFNSSNKAADIVKAFQFISKSIDVSATTRTMSTDELKSKLSEDDDKRKFIHKMNFNK